MSQVQEKELETGQGKNSDKHEIRKNSLLCVKSIIRKRRGMGKNGFEQIIYKFDGY